MCKDEYHQLIAFVKFVKSNNLDDEIRDHKWAAFARAYNGPAYAKNQYDVKLSRAHDKLEAARGVRPANDNGVLDIGDSGEKVVVLQNKLISLGYNITPDGKFGRMTERAIEDYQAKNGLAADGQVGPMTASKLGIDLAA
jgi:peptidoglycan hydrolase-like protein with peptidoglycan-binding domain